MKHTWFMTSLVLIHCFTSVFTAREKVFGFTEVILEETKFHKSTTGQNEIISLWLNSKFDASAPLNSNPKIVVKLDSLTYDEVLTLTSATGETVNYYMYQCESPGITGAFPESTDPSSDPEDPELFIMLFLRFRNAVGDYKIQRILTSKILVDPTTLSSPQVPIEEIFTWKRGSSEVDLWNEVERDDTLKLKTLDPSWIPNTNSIWRIVLESGWDWTIFNPNFNPLNKNLLELGVVGGYYKLQPLLFKTYENENYISMREAKGDSFTVQNYIDQLIISGERGYLLTDENHQRTFKYNQIIDSRRSGTFIFSFYITNPDQIVEGDPLVVTIKADQASPFEDHFMDYKLVVTMISQTSFEFTLKNRINTAVVSDWDGGSSYLTIFSSTRDRANNVDILQFGLSFGYGLIGYSDPVTKIGALSTVFFGRTKSAQHFKRTKYDRRKFVSPSSLTFSVYTNTYQSPSFSEKTNLLGVRLWNYNYGYGSYHKDWVSDKIDKTDLMVRYCVHRSWYNDQPNRCFSEIHHKSTAITPSYIINNGEIFVQTDCQSGCDGGCLNQKTCLENSSGKAVDMRYTTSTSGLLSPGFNQKGYFEIEEDKTYLSCSTDCYTCLRTLCLLCPTKDEFNIFLGSFKNCAAYKTPSTLVCPDTGCKLCKHYSYVNSLTEICSIGCHAGEGFALDPNTDCEVCDSVTLALTNCKSCDRRIPTNPSCTECFTPYLLLDYSISPYYSTKINKLGCVTQTALIKGLFFKGSSITFELCGVSNCSNCSSLSTCSKCKDLNNPSTVLYPYRSPSSITTCVECLQGYYIENERCKICPSQCSICLSSTICTGCKKGKYLAPDKISCIDSCPSNSIANMTTKVCESCGGNCAVCLNKTACGTCSPGFNITQTSTCISCPGPYGQVIHQSQCLTCPDSRNCQRCDDNPLNECSSCFENSLLHEKQCVLIQNLKPVSTSFIDTTISFLIDFDKILNEKLFTNLSTDFFTIEIQDQLTSQLMFNLKVESISLGAENKQIIIKGKLEKDVLNGKAIIKVKTPALIRSKKEPYIQMKENNIKVSPVKYSPLLEAPMKITAKALSSSLSILSLLMNIISAKMAMEMMKLAQMLEYLLYLNVGHPTILKQFLVIFRKGNILEMIPNPFSVLTNEKCKLMGHKFIQEDMECQFLGNVGAVLGIIILGVMVRILLEIIHWCLLASESKVKTISQGAQNKNKSERLRIWMKKKFGVERFFYTISGTHSEIYFSIFVNLKYFKSGDSIANINVFIGMLCFMFLLFMLVFFLFKASKVQETKSSNSKILREMYGDYFFLEEQTNKDNTFSKYYEVFLIMKDPVLTAIVVFFYDIPFTQTLLSFLIVSFMAIQELKYKPLKDKTEMKWTCLISICFCIVNGLFIVLCLIQDRTTASQANLFIGLPIVMLLVVISSSKVIPAVIETKNKIVSYWRKKKNKKNKVNPSSLKNNSKMPNKLDDSLEMGILSPPRIMDKKKITNKFPIRKQRKRRRKAKANNLKKKKTLNADKGD